MLLRGEEQTWDVCPRRRRMERGERREGRSNLVVVVVVVVAADLGEEEENERPTAGMSRSRIWRGKCDATVHGHLPFFGPARSVLPRFSLPIGFAGSSCAGWRGESGGIGGRGGGRRARSRKSEVRIAPNRVALGISASSARNAAVRWPKEEMAGQNSTCWPRRQTSCPG